MTGKTTKRALDRDLILSRKYEKKVFVDRKKRQAKKRVWHDKRILDEEEYNYDS